MRRFSLFGLVLASLPVPAQTPAPDHPMATLEALVERETPRGAGAYWIVADPASPRVYGASGADRLVRPASTLKLVTAAAFCATGGLSATIETSLWALPNGELRFLGGGDPFLSTAQVLKLARAVPEELRNAPIVVDSSRFGPEPTFGTGWMWDDAPAAWQPFVSALTLERGTITLTGRVGAEGRLFWHLYPNVGWFRRSDQDLESRPRPRRRLVPHERVIAVPRRLQEGRKSIRARFSVRDPDLWAGAALRAALNGDLDLAGGPLPDGDPPALRHYGVERASDDLRAVAGSRRLATIRRDPRELVRAALKDSDNFAAECLLAHIGARASPVGQSATHTGLNEVSRWFDSLGLADHPRRLVDGSGLSHYNLVTPRLLVTVLRAMERVDPDHSAVFWSSLPRLGVSGTLASRGGSSEAGRRVWAKTGTLSGVSGLAGRVVTENEVPLLFAILVQNTLDRSAATRLQDRFARTLAESQWPE